MGLEAATYISEFDAANPTAASDRVGQWDDHLRLIKRVLQNSFQSVSGPVTPTHTELNLLDGLTASAAELNTVDGITATFTELNYAAGLTSAVQTQIAAKRAGPTLSVKTSSFTAAVGNRYVFEAGSPRVVTLPTASLTAGDQIILTNASGSLWSANTGGVLVNGLVDTLFTILDGATVKLIYVDTTTGWARFQQLA